MVLIAVVLFAALSFVISQQSDSGKALSSEKTRLLASEVLDMANKMEDSVSVVSLHNPAGTSISFENPVMAGYVNPLCSTDNCKIFAPTGGGRDWETPVPEISKYDWVYTADIAVRNIGTDQADMLAILPDISETLCNQINSMLGLTGTIPAFNGVIVNKFAGIYPMVPYNITDVFVDGHKSACIKLNSPTGFAGVTATNFYVFYHVLKAR